MKLVKIKLWRVCKNRHFLRVNYFFIVNKNVLNCERAIHSNDNFSRLAVKRKI